MPVLPSFEMSLRVYVAVVAFMALGNTFACFSSSPTFLTTRLYNGKPEDVSPLSARLFGVWTLLACVVRAYCSMYLTNRVLYHITMISFVLAFLHFILELFVYKTCELGIGVISPLVVSGLAIILMFIGLWLIEFDEYRPPRHSTRSTKKK